MAIGVGTITGTLIEGLSQQMVQARVDSIDVRPFYFGVHFPVAKVNGFVWKSLGAQAGRKNVAADLHTDNGTSLRKRRPMFESARGDIPFISISREKDRSEIKEYKTELALARDADAVKLVQFWGDDVDFCFNGVQAELEYIAWALYSNAGKLAFTTTNNATFANEFDLDYSVDDFQKVSTATDWDNKSTADVIGDLVKAVKTAKEHNIYPRFAFVNLDEFYRIASSDQIMKACASYIANAIGAPQTPDLASVNAMLAKKEWLNGLQLRVIDQTITREFADGTAVSRNPFADRRIVLSESEILGSTQYDLLVDNNPLIINATRTHTIVKKYGISEPLSEVTIGQADAVPVLNSAYRNMYIRTDKQPWA